MFAKLEKYITDRIETDAPTLKRICSHFGSKTAKRNEFLLRAGDVCEHYYFVNKGCLRLFTINESGEEGTRYFAFEGFFGTALPSLIDGKPAFEFLQTVEKSELLVINRADFFALVSGVPQFAFIYREILEMAFIHAQRRIYNFQGMNALEKVCWIVENQPHLLKRVSNKLAASYLGLTPATLSRIKSKYRKTLL
ncbi:MAG: Crp/Fnr family transcriptional regulator [Pyrinomonadaceae bacterium]|nr:Crp/Fnr family transcriptional regulator [Pyrinomonadaceae bacterium]